VPSQQEPTRPPFDPSLQPDMTQEFLRPSAQIKSGADVRAIFDSRPHMGFDWYFEEYFQFGLSLTDPFPVPDGWTLVLRAIGIDMYPNSNSTGVGAISPFGHQETPQIDDFTPPLQILVNGQPSPLWTPYGVLEDPAIPGQPLRGVPIFNFTIGNLVIPVFVVIAGGQTVTVRAQNYINVPAADSPVDTAVAYYGNMLQSKGGTDALSEVVNTEPLAVAFGTP